MHNPLVLYNCAIPGEVSWNFRNFGGGLYFFILIYYAGVTEWKKVEVPWGCAHDGV